MSFYPPRRPYPPDLYSGADGERSAWTHPHDAPPDIGDHQQGCDYLATGEQTGDKFGMYRWRMAAGQGGPDAHFHRAMSESFYVLDGTITIFDGTSWGAHPAGDFVYVPEGGVHGFRNDSDAPASMLILFAPGAAREAYFEGLAARAAQGLTPSEEEMDEFFRAHDTYWV